MTADRLDLDAQLSLVMRTAANRLDETHRLAEARGNSQAEAAAADSPGEVDSETYLALIHRTLVTGEGS